MGSTLIDKMTDYLSPDKMAHSKLASLLQASKRVQVSNEIINGNFLENDFCPPSPLLSILYTYLIFNTEKFGHVAAAPGPLACPSCGARSPSLSCLQRSPPYPVLSIALSPLGPVLFGALDPLACPLRSARPLACPSRSARPPSLP